MKENQWKGVVCSILCALINYIHALDTISANQTLRDGETITSPQQAFELGFFRPGNSTNQYIGIWYKKVSTGTVVWVANRNTPLTNTSGELTLTLQGILVLRNYATGSIIWSSGNSSAPSLRNPVGQLLDTGNFIIYEEGENPIWQSFDFPTDTLLPGMKFGRDLVTGLQRNVTSWKSSDDPSPGEFSVCLDTRGFPQVIEMDGSNISFRAGPWNGLRFSGATSMRQNPIYSFKFVLDEREIYYQYNFISASAVTRAVIQTSGTIDTLLWIEGRQKWIRYMTPQIDSCDGYALCGPFGSCDVNNYPTCGCLQGFEPTSPKQWKLADWSGGCRRRTPLDCGPGEGFKKYSNLKLPDTQESRFNQSMNREDCERICKSECSCAAYTTMNISGSGSICILWFGNLIDIRLSTEKGEDLYIRMPASELRLNTDDRANTKSSSLKRRVLIIAPLASVILVILICICLFYQIKMKKQKRVGTDEEDFGHDPTNRSSKEDLELSLFGLSTLLKATNNFSVNHQLGEGGFGPVYKGVMEDGKEIAVKRLSKTSTQGLKEFKNEVICIAKLQHRNLVKLLGYCIQGDEMMLIYEYMPNKSLDSFIFDESRSMLLDWPKRFRIIYGIARGLMYLHQDSRLRIIHRDLKVGNILLDLDMNPKISDFGLARFFGGNETGANTKTVVGTYGYMSPEYAIDGIFSVKSDVFSFGVMVIEIISGKRNRGFSHPDHSQNLLGHAWKLYNDGKSSEIIDEALDDSSYVPEVVRLIQIGLLCVQHDTRDRPNMSYVVAMLGSEAPLPGPTQPGFFIEKHIVDHEKSSLGEHVPISNNKLTITLPQGR